MEEKQIDARTARERMTEAKEALSSLTVDVQSVKAAGREIRIDSIGALTIGAYKRLKKAGITKDNLLQVVNDPEKCGILLAEILGCKADDCDDIESPAAFAVVLHVAKKEQEKIDWKGPNGEGVRPT